MANKSYTFTTELSEETWTNLTTQFDDLSNTKIDLIVSSNDIDWSNEKLSLTEYTGGSTAEYDYCKWSYDEDTYIEAQISDTVNLYISINYIYTETTPPEQIEATFTAIVKANEA